MSQLIMQKWAVYEANVQQYRVLSATIQSFLLTVGTIMFSASNPPIYVVTVIIAMGIGHVVYVWVPITHSRSLIVDYYKYQFQNNLDEQEMLKLEKFCTDKQYVTDRDKRAQVNRDFFHEPDLAEWRPTRQRLDLIVPYCYVAVWILIILWKLFGITHL